MGVGPDEEDTECNHIASYSLKLPIVEQLLPQKDLQQGTSSGKQMKDERYERKGKFAKVVMNSPNATRNYAIEKERKHKENEINKTLYVTVHLPTTASKIAVKKAFMEFSEVHTVFAGRFKETDFKGIINGKRHIRLTPFKSKHDLPHEIQFPDDDRYFHVMWAEKKILCKKCFSVHMISKVCNDDRRGLVYQEGGFIIDTRLSYPKRVEETECPEGTTSEINVIAKTMGPGYPKVLEGASQTETSSKTPVNISTHNKDVETDLVDSQPGKYDQDNGPKEMVPNPWEDIPDEVPPDIGPNFSAPREETTCTDSSNRDKIACFVSTNNAKTTPSCNDTLELPNKDGPSVVYNVTSGSVCGICF